MTIDSLMGLGIGGRIGSTGLGNILTSVEYGAAKLDLTQQNDEKIYIHLMNFRMTQRNA